MFLYIYIARLWVQGSVTCHQEDFYLFYLQALSTYYTYYTKSIDPFHLQSKQKPNDNTSSL